MDMTRPDPITAHGLLRNIARELRDTAGRIPQYTGALAHAREQAELDRDAYDLAATLLESLLRRQSARWLMGLATCFICFAGGAAFGYVAGWMR